MDTHGVLISSDQSSEKTHFSPDPPISPSLSLQTYKGLCATSVKIAIDAGYRHFDGAYVYKNEHEVGEALREKIAEGKVRREDVFYCGKVSSCLPCLLVWMVGPVPPLYGRES